MGSGEKFEKNVTAIPRQFGYLETGRAMYEYAFYKDEEVAHARGLSTSLGTLPILQEAHYLRLASSFWVECVLLGVMGVDGVRDSGSHCGGDGGDSVLALVESGRWKGEGGIRKKEWGLYCL